MPARGVPARRSTSSTTLTGVTPASLVRRICTDGPCGILRRKRMSSPGMEGKLRLNRRALKGPASQPVKDSLLDDAAVPQMLDDDPLQQRRRYRSVPDAVGIDDDDRSSAAHTQTRCLASLHASRSEQQPFTLQ